jgi:flagellar assembly factor FliW
MNGIQGTAMIHTDTVPDGSEEKILRFDDGIPGFPQSRRFALIDVAPGAAFQFLQSLDDPDVSMVVTVPWLFFPDYAPELSDAERNELQLDQPEDAIIFCPVTLDSQQRTIYLNLLGPFVVNAKTRSGRQVVLADSGYPVRAPVKVEDL